MTYVSEVTADSPFLWFRGEDNANNSGSHSTGVSPSGLSYVAGKVGQAFDLNGSAYWTLGTSNGYYNNNTFTLEAWFKISGVGNAYYTIMRRSGTQHVILRVRGNVGANEGKAELYLQNAGGVVGLLSTGRVDDGNWHHIVVTVDRNAYATAMYIDGVLDNTGSHNGSTSSLTNAQNFGQEASGTERWVGQLDEVAVYTTVLTGARIAAHYDATYVAPGYRGWGIPV